MKPSLIIVGLGNPGKEYEDTRHNVGFRAVEKLAEEFGTDEWQPKQKFLADCCEGRIAALFERAKPDEGGCSESRNVPVLFVKPTTFMNNSGNAIRKLIDFFKIDPANQLLVICDDVDLPLGEIRLNKEGGAGSHNGLKSIVMQIGESFARLKIGIRGDDMPEGSFQQAGVDLSNYVLSGFLKKEEKKIDEVVSGIPSTVKEHIL